MSGLPNTSSIEVLGLTEVEAGKLASRLRYMKSTGILSGKVTIIHGQTGLIRRPQDGSRVSTYGGL